MAADGGGSARRRPRAGIRRGSRPRPGTPDRGGRADRAERAERVQRGGRPAKPAAAGLGVDLATLEWQRSGTAAGALEVAFVPGPGASRDPAHHRDPARGVREGTIQWVLLRVAGDPAGRVLVYDRTEWLSFVDGAANGEFDFAAG